MSELGELLGVTQQAASKQLLELERLGYVTRALIRLLDETGGTETVLRRRVVPGE
ncbi:hypothetical protein ACFOWZ_33750 [Lentzea rhizosphaerae]|uniref:MarR family protein n=1 Tax=Lentzea rhizosphaerae TaxID=2041025 RepID=A0ABV8C3L6_9PSEU